MAIAMPHALHLVLDDVFVLTLDHREQFPVALADFFRGDQAVVLQSFINFVQNHEGVDVVVVRNECVGDLVLNVTG